MRTLLLLRCVPMGIFRNIMPNLASTAGKGYFSYRDTRYFVSPSGGIPLTFQGAGRLRGLRPLWSKKKGSRPQVASGVVVFLKILGF